MVTEIKIFQSRNTSIKLSHTYKDIINVFQKRDTWKIQIKKLKYFIYNSKNSNKNFDEELVMHSKSDNTEVMVYDKADEVIDERFESLLFWYQIGLEISMRGSDFIFMFTYCTYYYLMCWIIYRFSWFNKKQKSNNKSHR